MRGFTNSMCMHHHNANVEPLATAVGCLHDAVWCCCSISSAPVSPPTGAACSVCRDDCRRPPSRRPHLEVREHATKVSKSPAGMASAAERFKAQAVARSEAQHHCGVADDSVAVPALCSHGCAVAIRSRSKRPGSQGLREELLGFVQSAFGERHISLDSLT
jgi:hypothetical protein